MVTMVSDKQMWNIGKHGIPKEYTACPSCGFQYGHHKTKVCMNCQECSKCCRCKDRGEKPDHQPASIAINEVLNGDFGG